MGSDPVGIVLQSKTPNVFLFGMDGLSVTLFGMLGVLFGTCECKEIQ